MHMAKDDKFEDPATEIKNATEEEVIPDPLDDEEREAVLEAMKTKFDERIWNHYEVLSSLVYVRKSRLRLDGRLNAPLVEVFNTDEVNLAQIWPKAM